MDSLLQDLSHMEFPDEQEEPPDEIDIDELAFDIEASIEKWGRYIEEEMPEFEDRSSPTDPTTVAEMVRQAGKTNG